MLSKSQIRFISALKQKKFRKEYGAFVVEGAKSVREFIDSGYAVQSIFCTPETFTKMGKIPQNIESFEISTNELKKISNLTTPQGVLALVSIPEVQETEKAAEGFTLVLDDVQDPGNLGTIIRTADWFGMKNIICSFGSVDAYNPKTVQASMGSLSRMQIIYRNLADIFSSSKQPVFGAMLDGQSIYDVDFGKSGYILLGNEGNGISEQIQQFITKPVTIPRGGAAESLNVAVSAALFCSEVFRQRSSKK